MGVPTQADCDGDAPIKMWCRDCGGTFWTDETMSNDCPECGHVSMNPA